jgi:hypothetical protein
MFDMAASLSLFFRSGCGDGIETLGTDHNNRQQSARLLHGNRFLIHLSLLRELNAVPMSASPTARAECGYLGAMPCGHCRFAEATGDIVLDRSSRCG